MDDAVETLGGLGEEDLVRRLVARLPSGGKEVVAGPGDDCAVIDRGGDRLLLLKTDCVVEGVHFLPGTDPLRVGRKAMNRALSDIAAMGGRPLHALVTLLSGKDRSVAEVEGWFAGIGEAAAAAGCSVVGGETASAPGNAGALSIALVGEVERELCLYRSGANAGDAILVTGRLGGSFPSGRHLDFSPRLVEARWLAGQHQPSAAMDLSDGLGADLPRLAAASGVGYEIDPASLPLNEGATIEHAVSDGEDYELLLTIPESELDALLPAWAGTFPELPMTRIGTIVDETRQPLIHGWEHFRKD